MANYPIIIILRNGRFMTIEKIVSGGQTGADRAALDFAMEYGIEHGGWVPEGRKAEDGPISLRYNLRELTGGDYADRTAKNVLDADGTLIVSHGELTGGSLLTWVVAEKNKKPVLHVDMKKLLGFDAAIDIHEWIEAHDIKALNIAGPRESKDPDIYRATRDLLETVFHIDIIAGSMPRVMGHTMGEGNDGMKDAHPVTVDEAVEYLLSRISPMEKMRIASSPPDALRQHIGLVENQPGTGIDNIRLVADCRRVAGDEKISGQDALMVVLRVFRKRLEQAGHLRVVK